MAKTWWVKWEDSASISPSWLKRTEIDPARHICYSTGWLVKSNKHSIWLASDSSPYCDGRLIQIPKSAILEKKKLDAA